MIQEPVITINDVRLHTGQAMTVRVALEIFAIDLQDNGCGDDEHGKRMTQHYLAAIQAIREMIRQGFPENPEGPAA